MHTVSEDWVQVIQEGKGYSGVEAARFRNLINLTKKHYALYQVIKSQVAAGAHVLEAGCGWACSSFALAEDGVQVTALDISSKLIEELKEVRRSLGGPLAKNLKLVAGDIFKLDELKTVFDLIFNDGTYEHFLVKGDRMKILSNISARLRPFGKYVVSVPHTGNAFFNIAVDRKMPPMYFFDIHTLSEELREGGFRVLESGYQFVNPGFEQWLKARWMAGPIWTVNRLFRYLPKFAKKFLAAHIYCVAQKIERGNE